MALILEAAEDDDDELDEDEEEEEETLAGRRRFRVVADDPSWNTPSIRPKGMS